MSASKPPENGDAEVAEALVLLAHDLKNPLAAVLTNLGFVRSFVEALDPDEPPDENELGDVRDAVLDARMACDSLQRFVSNLELLARDLGGRVRAPGEAPPLDLLALADEVCERQRTSAEARRLQLVVQNGGQTCWARADRELVVRAVDNLIGNAIQYAPAGTRISVLVTKDKEATLAVIDEGIVIPEPSRADAVTRAGQGRAKGRPEARYGRGLGLHAAAIAARAAGGHLVVGERDGKSSLAIVLPCFEE